MPIKMLTCYDYWTAKILATTNIDCVLVGDSAAMVMHGHKSTISADIEMLALHVQAVRRGIGEKFVIGDMPFLSYRKSISNSMSMVEKLMKAGANSIKLEGLLGNEKLIRRLVTSGIPVMGHLGFMPQSINAAGGAHVQCKDKKGAELLLREAEELEQLGCFAVVLECIPAPLAEAVTNTLSIPTIGIGAGAGTTGQVLVFQDMLGMDQDFQPKFLKKYMDGFTLIKDAVNTFCAEIDNGVYPAPEHIYGNKKDADS